jgi:tetratricopeptide (TPR) repeat protein
VAGAGLIRVSPMEEIMRISNLSLSIKEKAKKLNVKYILTSSLYKKENEFDLRCQLIAAESGSSKYANKWSESIDKAPTIVGNLADIILKSLKVTTKQDITRVPSTNAEAYEYYLKAKYKFEKRENQEGTEIARGLLQKAIELDNNLILAKQLLGWSYEAELDLENAFKIYFDNVNQAEKLGDKRGMARSLHQLSSIYSLQGNWEKSYDCVRRSFDIFMELGDKAGIASTQKTLSWYFMDKKDFDSALDYLTRALKVQEEIDDKWEMRFTLWGLGELYKRKGDYEKSLSYYTRTLEIREQLGDKWGMGNALSAIGSMYYNKGQYDKAMDYFDRSLKIRKSLGDKTRLANNNLQIGRVLYDKGDYEKAVEYIKQSISIQKEIGLGTDNLIWETTYLYLTYKKLGKKYDENEIHSLIKEAEDINYTDLNYRIYKLLGDSFYLEAAYNQVQEQADSMEDKFKANFLSYPIPKAIVEEWEKLTP